MVVLSTTHGLVGTICSLSSLVGMGSSLWVDGREGSRVLEGSSKMR